MRFLALGALLPFALAAPAPKSIPELSVSQWTQVQSSFVDGLRSLSQWSWAAAEELIDEVEAARTDGDDTQKTIWQQLKEDPNSFSKLVRIINVRPRSSPSPHMSTRNDIGMMTVLTCSLKARQARFLMTRTCRLPSS